MASQKYQKLLNTSSVNQELNAERKKIGTTEFLPRLTEFFILKSKRNVSSHFNRNISILKNRYLGPNRNFAEKCPQYIAIFAKTKSVSTATKKKYLIHLTRPIISGSFHKIAENKT